MIKMRKKLNFHKISITFDWLDGFSKFKNSQKAKIVLNEKNHTNLSTILGKQYDIVQHVR